MSTPLNAVPQLASVRTKLESLGHITVESVREAARIAPNELSNFVGQPIVPLLAGVPIPAGAAPIPAYPLGVNLAAIPAPVRAYSQFAGVGAPPPPSANNVALLGAVGNQGTRFTCVGFSCCAVFESYLALQNGGAVPAPSSPQYLYYDCKEHDGDPTARGTYVAVAFELLKNDGVCLDATWAYDPLPHGPEGEGPPPPAAIADAQLHKIPSYAALAPTSVLEVQTQLAKGLCVAISIPVFASWYANAAIVASGGITMPIPTEVPLGGHAVCLVGYRSDATQPGGGVFVVRNSWGSSWGKDSVDRPGYGTLPFAYLAAYGREAYCIQS